MINVKYVDGIACQPLATGDSLYLATVIDCCSRRVPGAMCRPVDSALRAMIEINGPTVPAGHNLRWPSPARWCPRLQSNNTGTDQLGRSRRRTSAGLVAVPRGEANLEQEQAQGCYAIRRELRRAR